MDFKDIFGKDFQKFLDEEMAKGPKPPKPVKLDKDNILSVISFMNNSKNGKYDA